MPAKLTVVFPIRFKEYSDIVIAKAFFQELVDVGNSGACARAPPCYWSPIPPPELRGESMKDLSTNGGFVSFEISARHIEGKKLDKTVWNLLNFNALVKYHVKCTKGFVQRRMRSRLQSLVEALQQHTGMEEDHNIAKVKGIRKRWFNLTLSTRSSERLSLLIILTRNKSFQIDVGHRRMKKLIKFTRGAILMKRWNLRNKIKRFRSRIRIRGFKKFQRRWLKLPSFTSVTSYHKLEKF
ncbi:putative arp2/3 complex subunit protein [Helianthus annuus]|nr:putative arp2/3 complex subunit protein [Helianthus annuus]